MASALETHMVKRGVRLISPAEGPRLLVEELCRGRKGQCEVVLTGEVATWLERTDSSRPAHESMMVQEGQP
jgi:hypothetical protein